MKFNILDLACWTRAPYFEHYMNQVRCTFSMTANLDITLLLATLKKQQIKLYPALMNSFRKLVTSVVS